MVSRGETYRRMGRNEEALADFNRAIEHEPDNAVALASRGQVFRDLGRYEEALVDFNRGLELDSNLNWAIADRGETYRRMGRNEEALADFNRAIERDPDYAFALANRGETYRLMGDYPAALADFDHVIELEPQNDWSYYDRGLLFLIEKRSGQAQTDFSLAIQQANTVYEKDPENWRNTFNLAIYHLASGRVEEAESLYRKTLNLPIPADSLRESFNDLNNFLHFFPDHPQAKAMRDLIQNRLETPSSC